MVALRGQIDQACVEGCVTDFVVEMIFLDCKTQNSFSL